MASRVTDENPYHPHEPHWTAEEEFKRTVILRAQLLGFTAQEIQLNNLGRTAWEFEFKGIRRFQYASLYSAAYDYLRLMRVPWEVVGNYNP